MQHGGEKNQECLPVLALSIVHFTGSQHYFVLGLTFRAHKKWFIFLITSRWQCQARTQGHKVTELLYLKPAAV